MSKYNTIEDSTLIAQETDTAWGRSRFTEAEIKKAFELRDHELRKAEDEVKAGRASEKDGKSGRSKSEQKREEDMKKKKDEARKKEESKQKKKETDQKKKALLGGFPLIGRKRSMEGGDEIEDEEEEDDDDDANLSENNQEAQAWSTLLSYNFSQDALELAGIVAEHTKCDSFEEWLLTTNDATPTQKLQTGPIFASQTYNHAMEEALNFIQGSSCTFSMLGQENVTRILELMDTKTLISAVQVCKSWREYGRNKEMWKSRFFALEHQMFGQVPDVNIWEELGTNFATIVRDQQGQVKEASLNKLVAAVTPQAELPDMMDVSTFLVTYQTFTTTSQLIRKLMQRYIVPTEKPDATPDEIKTYTTSVVRPIQMRVCKLFKSLIETQHRDIDEQLLELIKLFVLGIIDQTVLAKLIQAGVQSVVAKNKSLKDAQNASSIVLSGNASLKKPSLMGSLYDLSSEEIARHLTLIEFEVYSQIKPTEFFGQAWAKPKNHHRAPNIRAMIDRFNVITRWITTEIVNEEKIRNRVKRCMKFIKIAQALRTMHNYHTLMAILGGLNEGPVFRLKFTKAEIPPKFQQAVTELQTLMSADGSYNAYRIELASATPPCIPYIGVYLRDLTYFDEGAAGAEGLINFKSKKNVYSVIQIIQKYQGTVYPFKPNERAYNYLKSIEGLDDATLHKTSLLREPKNAKRADIQ